MSHKRLVLNALGVCLLGALSLMAFVASAAQAAHADWLLETAVGSGMYQTITTLVKVNAKEDTTAAPLELLVPAINLAIRCPEFEVIDGLFHPGGTSTGGVTFKKCKVLDAAACVVNSPGDPVGTIKVTGKDRLIHHTDGEMYDIFEPVVAGGSFGLIEITECAAETASPECLKGKVAVLISFTHVVNQLIKEYANQALLGAGLFYGTHPATLDGAAELFLIGADTGKKWGANLVP